MFKILKKDKNSFARTGIIETAHGIIETPAYAIVGTHGQIKCLPAEKITETKTQLTMANTYHLWQKFKGLNGALDNLPAVQNFFGNNMPTMTDSGGFQVFSHGFGREHGIGKLSNLLSQGATLDLKKGRTLENSGKNLVRITEEGAFFYEQPRRSDAMSEVGTPTEASGFLGPKLSIKIQEKLGADLILAFDECTSPYHDYAYNKTAMERTHRWAKICLQAQTGKDQILYGIIQGGQFKDLREESAKFINSLPFGGIAIGGSFSKSPNGSFDVLHWTIPYLTEGHPRHFLGIGRVGDIFESVELGIDTFDCVIPTREARHGGVYTKQGRIDAKKTIYEKDQSKLDQDCLCPACQNLTKAKLRQQFKDKNPIAGENATIHNVFFFNHLMTEIREAIKNNRLQELKKEYLPHFFSL